MVGIKEYKVVTPKHLGFPSMQLGFVTPFLIRQYFKEAQCKYNFFIANAMPFFENSVNVFFVILLLITSYQTSSGVSDVRRRLINFIKPFRNTICKSGLFFVSYTLLKK